MNLKEVKEELNSMGFLSIRKLISGNEKFLEAFKYFIYYILSIQTVFW